MIKKIYYLFVVIATATILTSCSITAPLAISSSPIGKKIGTAKATIICGLTFNSDYSIQTAAQNGGITKISTVDVKYFNLLGFYMTRTTIVTGE